MNLISTFLPIFVVSVSMCEWLLQSVSSVLTLFINKWESEVNQIGFCRCISRKEWYQTLFSQKRKWLHFMEGCTHVIWSKILCFIDIVFGKLYRRNKCPCVYILLERFSNKLSIFHNLNLKKQCQHFCVLWWYISAFWMQVIFQ